MRPTVLVGLFAVVLAGQGSEAHLPLDSVRGALLALARRANADLNAAPVRTQLDVFEIELKERLTAAASPRDKVNALVRYFFEEHLFTADDDLSNPGNFYVDQVLMSKQGYCLSLSTIILAVTERLKLPIFGVAAPRHFFLRWDDGTVRINIETTEKGSERSDTFYRARGVSDQAEKDGVYLRNLTTAEVIAYLLNNEGFIHWGRGDVDQAEVRFLEAKKIHPHLAEAHINLGVVAGERGDETAAGRHFNRVLGWLPKDAVTLLNRSLVALKGGRFREALLDLERASHADPRSRHLVHYREFALATILRPKNWLRYQAQVVLEGETLRRSKRLRPGLLGHYFSSRDLTGTSVSRVDRTLEFEWRYSAPDRRIPADHFSVRWTGFVDIPEDGAYTFLTVSNDGIRVWVDEVRIIDDWKEQEAGLNQETLKLSRGLHPLRIEYFEHIRFAGISFRVKRSEGSKPLPPSALLHLP